MAIVLLIIGLTLGGCATTEKAMIDATLEKAAQLRLEAESSPNVGLVQSELRDSRAKQRRAERYVKGSIDQPLLELESKDRLMNRAQDSALASLESAKLARDKAAQPPVVLQHPKKPARIIRPIQQPQIITQTVQEQPVVEVQPEPAPQLEAKPASVTKPARSSSSSLAAENPAQAYQEALDDYNDRRFSRSRMGFSDFLAINPAHKLAPNAQYWLGETYYAESNWTQALTAFEEVLSAYPGSRKEADALCKIGLTQRNQGRMSQSRSSLNQCVDRFPKSRAARVARQALAKMG